MEKLMGNKAVGKNSRGGVVCKQTEAQRTRREEKILTQDERLAEALVPEGEQPYAVPENWIYVYFTSLIDIQGGTQPPKNQFIDVPKAGYVRLVQIRDFATDKYTVYVPKTGNLKYFNKNDVLIARYGASLGRICTGLSGVYNVALAKTIFSEKVLSRKYVFWMLQSECFQVPLMQLSRTAQAGFNKEDLSYFPVPLPPLAEQRRIVERIESLFEKLDCAKELARNALDSFETRKATILHKAFTGELTRKWREENGVGMESWEEKRLGDIIKEGPQNGLYKSKTTYGNGIRIIRIDGFYDGNIGTWDNIKRLKLDALELELYKLNVNDILINRVNSMPYLGKSALVRELPEVCVFESNIMRLSLSVSVEPEYLIRYLNSAQGLFELRKNAKQAVNQASINQQDVKNVILPLPSLPEQQEIVRIFNSLFEKEQQAQEQCDIIGKIDLLKKAILARAFRGELGTNDPGEESAVLAEGVVANLK